MEKIIGNEQEIKELLSKETVDDLYEFFLKKDSTLTMEEFDDEVYDILENYSETANEKIDQNTLEQISGGKNDFIKKTLATSLSALTIGSVATSSAFAAGTSRIKNGSLSVAMPTKDIIKGGFVKIGRWLSAHKKAVAITGGAIGAAAIGAIILTVAIKHKNADKNIDVTNPEKQKDANKTFENSSAPSSSNVSNEERQGINGDEIVDESAIDTQHGVDSSSAAGAASPAGTASDTHAVDSTSPAGAKGAASPASGTSDADDTSSAGTASGTHAVDTERVASAASPASSVSTGGGSEHIPQQPGDIELKDMGGNSSSAADVSPDVTTASPKGRDDGDNPGAASKDLPKSRPEHSAGTTPSPSKKGGESPAPKKYGNASAALGLGGFRNPYG